MKLHRRTVVGVDNSARRGVSHSIRDVFWRRWRRRTVAVRHADDQRDDGRQRQRRPVDRVPHDVPSSTGCPATACRPPPPAVDRVPDDSARHTIPHYIEAPPWNRRGRRRPSRGGDGARWPFRRTTNRGTSTSEAICRRRFHSIAPEQTDPRVESGLLWRRNSTEVCYLDRDGSDEDISAAGITAVQLDARAYTHAAYSVVLAGIDPELSLVSRRPGVAVICDGSTRRRLHVVSMPTAH